MIDRKTIGVVGYGFVGEAVAKGLAPVADVVVYDKAKGWLEIVGTDYGDGEIPEATGWLDYPDWNDPWACLVQKCPIIFICVPTPMRQDGSCSTEIVEEVVRGLNGAQVERLNKGDQKNRVTITDGFGENEKVSYCEGMRPPAVDGERIIVVIKSTVPPGTTARLQSECGWLDLVFNPEFLTEKNYLRDFAEMDRVILGGEAGKGIDETWDLYRTFGEWQVENSRVRPVPFNDFDDSPTREELTIHSCSSTEAEMVKYLSNCFLATKVSLANEFAQVCEKVGADWDTVWGIASTDERLGDSHWRVPGPDGKKGFGGSCVPPSSMVELKRKGIVSISECSEGEEILSCNGLGEGLEWKRIREVTSRMFDGDLIRFETEFGDFLCTPEHLMPVIRNGVLQIIRAEEVGGDDQLVRPDEICSDHVPTLLEENQAAL